MNNLEDKNRWKDETCWTCAHMDTGSEFDDKFYCSKLNRWFSKQSQDDSCSDWDEDYGTPLEVRR